MYSSRILCIRAAVDSDVTSDDASIWRKCDGSRGRKPSKNLNYIGRRAASLALSDLLARACPRVLRRTSDQLRDKLVAEQTRAGVIFQGC